MKFKINRDHFSAGLGQVVSVVNNRLSLPVLVNVLIEAENDSIRLTTTNLDLRISCKIKAEVMDSGKITLPAKWLKDIVSGFKSSDVFVEMQGESRVKITSGSSKFNPIGIASTDFPPEPPVGDEFAFEIEQGDLATMIKSVSYAQSTDENRYVLNGVLFSFNEDKVALVATDGRRLATCEKKMSVSVENPTQFILPAKTISELQKQLGSAGKIRFALSERQVVFEIDVAEGNSGLMDKIRIVSKIVEGNYPQYKGVIPKDSGNRIEIEREDLLSAVLQAAKVTTDKNSSVVLNISANQIEITASSTEYGEASDKLAVRYEGPEARIAFNPQFITDPLKALTQDSVVFEFKDDLSPGVFKTKDESFLCVVMPQRK